MLHALRICTARTVLAGILAACTLYATGAPIAAASSVAVTGGQLVITDADDVQNVMEITQNGSTIRVYDSKAAPVAGLGCTQPASSVVDCLISVDAMLAQLGGGDDTIVVRSNVTATSTVVGGVGADTLITGSANDSLSGGSGNDVLAGGGGVDTLAGGGGVDSAVRSENLDMSVVGRTIHVTSTDTEVLDATVELIALEGGRTANKLTARRSAVPVLLYGLAGNDRLIGSRFEDLLSGGLGSDTLVGGRRWDDLYGGDGNDTITGGAGRDRAFGGRGRDTLLMRDGERDRLADCGTGRDRLVSDRIDRRVRHCAP